MLRATAVDGPAASVLVTFERHGTSFRACPGFITGLTFEDDELVDVACEPWTTNWRWAALRAESPTRSGPCAALRLRPPSTAASGSTSRTVGAVARKMQYAKGIDPTMALYAAYAYYDLQTVERIEADVALYLRDVMGVSLLTVELLARKLVGRRLTAVGPDCPVFATAFAGLAPAERTRDPVAPRAGWHRPHDAGLAVVAVRR